MTIKYTALLLLAFTCIPHAHAQDNPKSSIPATIIAITLVHWGVLSCLNVPLSKAKKIGFKKNLSPAHIFTCAAVGTALSLGFTIASATSCDDQKKHRFDADKACNNHLIIVSTAAVLITGYNIYQCTKEEPKTPAKIALPAHINTQVLGQLHNKNQLTNRDDNDN